MKLDKYICKGGRLNKKDILGIKINGKHIYPIVDSIYNVYEIKVPSDVNSICKLYFISASNIASKSITPFFEFSGNINPTIEEYELIGGISGYRCDFNTPGTYTLRTTEFIYMPYAQTYNLEISISAIRTDIVNADSLFDRSTMVSCDCFRTQGPALTELANIDYLLNGNKNLLNMTFEDIKAPNLTSAIGPVYGCTALQTLKFINCEMPNLATASNLTYYCHASNIELINCDFSGSTDVIIPYSSTYEPNRNTTHFKMNNCNFSSATNELRIILEECIEKFEITDCYFSHSINLSIHNRSKLEKIDFSGNNFDGLNSYSNFTLSSTSSFTDVLDLSNCSMKNIKSIRFNSSTGNNLKRIILDGAKLDSLTSLYRTFYSMTELTEFDLSSAITGEINDIQYAFDGCTMLKSVVFNDKITNLAYCGYAFRNCTYLTKVDMRNANLVSSASVGYMFSGCEMLKELRLDNCNNDTIKKIITSSNFPTGYIANRLIYCKEANVQGLTAPQGWAFSYVD